MKKKFGSPCTLYDPFGHAFVTFPRQTHEHRASTLSSLYSLLHCKPSFPVLLSTGPDLTVTIHLETNSVPPQITSFYSSHDPPSSSSPPHCPPPRHPDPPPPSPHRHSPQTPHPPPTASPTRPSKPPIPPRPQSPHHSPPSSPPSTAQSAPRAATTASRDGFSPPSHVYA